MEQTLANIKSGRFDSLAQVPTATMIERWKESKKLSACELLRSCSARKSTGALVTRQLL